MKSIETLAWLYRIFGWLRIILGGLPLITGQAFSFLVALSITQGVASGAAFLILARALLKKEQWAWYIALILTVVIGPIEMTMHGIAFEFNLAFLLVAASSIWMLFLLIKGRKVFADQPKESPFQWFQKGLFVSVLLLLAVSVAISLIVFSGIVF